METGSAKIADSDPARVALRRELQQLIASRAAMAWREGELNDAIPLGADGLGLDSVAVVEVLLACEKRWGIPFPAELLEQLPLTVGKLLDHLQRARKP